MDKVDRNSLRFITANIITTGSRSNPVRELAAEIGICYIAPMIAENSLRINEIFYSIQGESTYAGQPCVFVRLTYCNLRCTYCDTEYAFYDGSDMTLDAIMTSIAEFDCRLVEITGGEPLLQKPVLDLMSRCCDAGYQVLLETGGSLDISTVDRRVARIVDMKCPSSGMAHKNNYDNLARMGGRDELKFVMGNRDDYQWSVDLLRRFQAAPRVNAVLFSPIFDSLQPQTLAEWILHDRLSVEFPNLRFQLQMHKFIWSPEMHGV